MKRLGLLALLFAFLAPLALQATVLERSIPIAGSELLESGVVAASKVPTMLKPKELTGEVAANFNRFMSKIPANSKASASVQLLDDGRYVFSATSPGRVPGSSATYQKWVNSAGETVDMLKTTVLPDGSIAHVKSKM